MSIPDRGPPLQVVCYAFGILAILATILRVYVRVFLVKSFGWDDGWMLAALVCFIGFVVSALVGVHFGAGRKMADILPQENIIHAIQCWWFCYLWYCLSITAVKVSISWFLLRVIVKRIHAWIVYFVLALNVVSGFAFFFITLLQCKPVHAFWNRTIPGKCLGMDAVIAVTYVYGACGIICDLTITVLPMFIIWGLNMDKRTKWALMPVMGLACVASTATIVRFVYCKDAKKAEFLYETINIVVWSTIEQGLAIIAACLACLRPLLRLVAAKIGFSSTGPSELRDDYHRSDRFQETIESGNRQEQRNSNGLQLSSIKAKKSNGQTGSHYVEDWENESAEELTAGYKARVVTRHEPL